MRLGFYPKLAVDGISKNRRLYFPYILTSICMVMMQYLIAFLAKSDAVSNISGGESLQFFMSLGQYVIAFFSVMFLFYSNSFIIKRRKKEFGVFNILGMGKRHIGIVVFWEVLYTFLISLVGGLLLGIAFSKFAELGLMKLTRNEVNLSFTVPFYAIKFTVIVFSIIYVLILLNSIRQIRFSSAINLLKSDNVGEKPPKANWFVGVLGLIILGAAYFMAVIIDNPVDAVIYFFIAVLLVILGTYLVMIFSSVVICRVLKNNKNYYYKLNNYVSVSSMMYRMKRNGAGLASICVLSTMVLVMISSTSCLYFGSQDSLDARNPRQICIEASSVTTDNNAEDFIDDINSIVESAGEKVCNAYYYECGCTYGYYNNGDVVIDVDLFSDNTFNFSNVMLFTFMPVSEYNRLNGTNEVLSGNDVIVYSKNAPEIKDTVNFMDADTTLNVVKRIDNEPCIECLTLSVSLTPEYYFVVSDYSTVMNILTKVNASNLSLSTVKTFYLFDFMSGNQQKETEVRQRIINDYQVSEDSYYQFDIESRNETKVDFFSSYGGLFYLGIVLSIVFILASVLIIYYKQITEGYEDQGRFEIMQKVGMTKKEIRKGINSQLRTVFFLPLILSAIHVMFAFPMIRNLLLLFNLNNNLFFAVTTIICFIVFAVLYGVVYKITSNAYYKIVSSKII